MIIPTTLLLLAGLALLGMAAPTPIIKGISSIVWGTEGQLGSPAGAIVESVAITPKNPSGVATIENGDGAMVSDVLLDDGFDAKVTCVYDKSKTWPTTGTAITLTIPNPQGAGGMTAFPNCYVTGMPDINSARKKEATITLMLRYRPLITS